jgi:hypothetical protein
MKLDNLDDAAESVALLRNLSDRQAEEIERLTVEHATLKEAARKAVVEWLIQGDISGALAALSRHTKVSP